MHELHVTYGHGDQPWRALSESLTEEARMVWWAMSHADHRGTDVRLDVGAVVRPDRIARHSVGSSFWEWKAALSSKWLRREDHTNEKEARAAFVEVRRRSRVMHHHGSRYLHLLDSSVSIGVPTKHRSSCYRSQRVTNRQNAVELGSNTRPIYAFVRSSQNPADWPSRRNHARSKKSAYRC